MDRRAFLRRSSLLGLGLVAGSAGEGLATAVPASKDSVHGAATERTVDSRLGSTAVTWRVHTDQRLIALTFDDGPMPHWTPAVLEVLAHRKVRATFNLVGSRVHKHAELLRPALTAGHEFGNHTWGHLDLATLDRQRAFDEINRAHEAIRSATGQAPRHLRPPYGHLSGSALLAAGQLGYDVVLWSMQLHESELDELGNVRYVLDGAVPGTILLAHDVGTSDRLVGLRALPGIIDGLRALDYRFVTTSELLVAASGQASATN